MIMSIKTFLEKHHGNNDAEVFINSAFFLQ